MSRVNMMATWEQERDKLQQVNIATKEIASNYTQQREHNIMSSYTYGPWINRNQHDKIEL